MKRTFLVLVAVTGLSGHAATQYVGDMPRTTSIAPTNFVQMVIQKVGTDGTGSDGQWRLVNATNFMASLGLNLDKANKKVGLYNTYTDASNYEEGFLKWETNTLKLGTASAGTGQQRNIELSINDNVRVGLVAHTLPSLTKLTDRHGRAVAIFGQISSGYNSGQSGWAFAGAVMDNTNSYNFIRIGPTAGVNQGLLVSDLSSIDIGGSAGNYGGPKSTRVGWLSGNNGYNLTSGYDTYFGYYSGAGRNFGTNNIAVGVYSFYATTTRNYYRTNCIAIGGNSLYTTNSSAANITNLYLLVVGHNSGFHLNNMVTNVTIIGHETHANENNIFVINTNQTMVIGGTSRTNAPIQFSATNCIISTPITVNGQPGKTITNTWYSVTSDGSTVVTNVQVYVNGILTSWKINGNEL